MSHAITDGNGPRSLSSHNAYSAAATAFRMKSERVPPLASMAATIDFGNFTLTLTNGS